jgi:hypothetical protein
MRASTMVSLFRIIMLTETLWEIKVWSCCVLISNVCLQLQACVLEQTWCHWRFFYQSRSTYSIVYICFRVLDMSLEFILCAFDLTMIGAFCQVKYAKDWYVNYNSVRGESDWTCCIYVCTSLLWNGNSESKDHVCSHSSLVSLSKKGGTIVDPLHWSFTFWIKF